MKDEYVVTRLAGETGWESVQVEGMAMSKGAKIQKGETVWYLNSEVWDPWVA